VNPKPGFKPVTILARLLSAFAVMIATAVFCGAVGVVFVDQIGKSVSVFSDGTSPLLTESLALIDDAQRMRATFLSGLAADENADELSSKLTALHNRNRNRLTTLRELAARPGINLSLDTLDDVGQSVAGLFDKMIAAQRTERALNLKIKQQLANFATRRREFDAKLQTVINRVEGKISKSEDEAKVDVQTGTATVDGLGSLLSEILTQAYPIVQNGQRLLQESRRLGEAAEALLPSDINSLPQVERSLRDTFNTTDRIIPRLAGRMRDPLGSAEMATIRSIVSALESDAVGPAGLLALKANILEAQEEIAAGREALDRSERLYFNALENVVHVVRAINSRARDETIQTITWARSVILGSVLLALFGGLTFGVIFARRLVRPLTVLAGHAEAIRASSKVTEISDTSITQAPDEFGVLARSFNRMIAEIIVARQRLVDWSEAQLTIQYERLDAALNNMSQGLIMIDKEKRLVLCNDRYIEMYGLSRDIVKPGCSLEELIRHRAELGHRLRSADQARETSSQLEAGKPALFLLETRDDREISVVQQPMSNGGWVSTHEDITERRAAQAKISHMALHDALTNLPNRVFFHEKVRELFARGERCQKFAVMCFDLDRFKNVNDTLGHKFGDILLRQVAERVRGCLREGDTLARLGGDEFAILLADCSQAAEVNSLAARLNKIIGLPFDLEGHQAVIGVSIGIAVAPTDAENPEQLLKNADLALYRAKTDGRGTYRFFQPEMDALMQKRRALEFDLRRALSKGEFELFYQPIVNLVSGDVAGFEALLRWNHPERGLVSPLDFIGLAEETELIIPIGDWVLREACREAMKWPSNVRIAVNVSPIQFKSELALTVTAALAQSGLNAQRLELEITESVLLHNAEATLAMLHQLRALGVSISMDDFGTGYSSLSYLRSFPFDKIKIDRSFVHNVAQNEDSMAIVRAVTGLGSSLGMVTTGEGVETVEESSYLKSQGCTEAQGFLFSKPRPANEVPDMLLNRSKVPRAVA